jgi:hypothetical protein
VVSSGRAAVPPWPGRVAQIKQRDRGPLDWKAATVEEIPAADADVEVMRADMAVVELEEAALGTTPEEPTGEAEDDGVVERQPGPACTR